MKNLVLIAMAMVTFTATAQEGKKEAMQARKETRQQMTPEETAKLQTKRMTLRLDLNERQQGEVEKLFLAQATEQKAKMEAFKEDKAKAKDEKRSKEERLEMQHDRLDNQIEMKRKLKAILNPEQYDKLERMQEKRQGKRGKKGQLRKSKE